MRRRESVRDVGHDGDGCLGREPPLPVEPGPQIRTADEVHDQGEVVAVDHEVAYGDDVRVVEAQQGRPLLHETAHELLVGREVLAQQLDGDGALGPLAEPHRAGAAPPQNLVGGVPAADLPYQDCSYGRVLPIKLRAQSANLLFGDEITPQVSTNPQNRTAVLGI